MKKFLIIRFSSIGDIVLTTPVIRCLKQQIPGSEIHFLTKKQFLPVLSANPYLDKLISIEKNIEEIIPELKIENYDLIIDLHKNIRSKGVIFKLRQPSVSFKKINFQKWLIVNLKINKLPGEHIVDRYLQTVDKLGVKNDLKGLDYFIPQKDEVNLTSFPVDFRTSYVAWIIGGKHETKVYPTEKIIDIIPRINKSVILLGGPGDEEKGEEIRNKIGEGVFNACGKFNINQSASLVKQAEFVITNDTGLMHIAAAFNKKIFSFWGNTIPEFGMYPYLPAQQNKSFILEVKNLGCRPCSKIGYKKCPKGHFDCMNKIELNDLFNFIDDTH